MSDVCKSSVKAKEVRGVICWEVKPGSGSFYLLKSDQVEYADL